MKSRKALAVGTAATAALAMGVTALGVGSAQAAGTTSLAKVLIDGNKFDRNAKDFDILAEAVLAVLAAKPDSTVGVLADGSVKLTAFAPTDQAFKNLASDLEGRKIKKEKKAFKIVASLGIDTVESVLLYHVVPGAPITGKKALQANNVKLQTALEGETIKVKVKSHPTKIKLVDKDRNDRNAKVQVTNINKGNNQIAHVISHVLRPADL
ncbi:MAG: putative surface protein with fasciclin (FAS1) repeats [Actinomycetes bacterium]|jgi:uncharacterized surface protein with fasciclin (FAS1) repeats